MPPVEPQEPGQEPTKPEPGWNLKYAYGTPEWNQNEALGSAWNPWYQQYEQYIVDRVSRGASLESLGITEANPETRPMWRKFNGQGQNNFGENAVARLQAETQARFSNWVKGQPDFEQTSGGWRSRKSSATGWDSYYDSYGNYIDPNSGQKIGSAYMYGRPAAANNVDYAGYAGGGGAGGAGAGGAGSVSQYGGAGANSPFGNLSPYIAQGIYSETALNNLLMQEEQLNMAQQLQRVNERQQEMSGFDINPDQAYLTALDRSILGYKNTTPQGQQISSFAAPPPFPGLTATAGQLSPPGDLTPGTTKSGPPLPPQGTLPPGTQPPAASPPGPSPPIPEPPPGPDTQVPPTASSYGGPNVPSPLPPTTVDEKGNPVPNGPAPGYDFGIMGGPPGGVSALTFNRDPIPPGGGDSSIPPGLGPTDSHPPSSSAGPTQAVNPISLPGGAVQPNGQPVPTGGNTGIPASGAGGNGGLPFPGAAGVGNVSPLAAVTPGSFSLSPAGVDPMRPQEWMFLAPAAQRMSETYGNYEQALRQNPDIQRGGAMSQALAQGQLERFKGVGALWQDQVNQALQRRGARASEIQFQQPVMTNAASNLASLYGTDVNAKVARTGQDLDYRLAQQQLASQRRGQTLGLIGQLGSALTSGLTSAFGGGHH